MDGKGYGKYLVCSFACFLCFFFLFFFLEAYSIKLLITNECFKEELARFKFFVTIIEIQRMNTLFS